MISNFIKFFIIFLFAVAGIINISYSQIPYERWINGNIFIGSNGKLLPDKRVIITGRSYPSTTIIIKTDSAGYPVAPYALSIAGHNTSINGSEITEDNKILLLTNNSLTGTLLNHSFLSKWDTSMTLQWANSYLDTAYDGVNALYIDPISDGDEYSFMVNFFDTIAPYGNAAAIIKTDSAGNLKLAKKLPAGLSVSKLIRSNDSGYIALGNYNTSRIYLKTDSLLNVQWAHKYSASFSFRNEQIIQRANNDIYILTGIRDTDIVLGFSHYYFSNSMALIKINPANGNIISVKEIDFQHPVLLSHLIRAADDNLLAAGTFDNGTLLFSVLHKYEAFMLKIRPDGSIVWADTLTMPDYRSRFVSIKESSNRFMILAERYDDINPFNQFFITDTSASPVCNLLRGQFIPLGSLTITDSIDSISPFIAAQVQSIAIVPVLTASTLSSFYNCTATGIKEISKENTTVFPNPFHNEVTVKTGTDFSKKSPVFQLFNSTGSDAGKIELKLLNDAFVLNFANLNNGIYFLRMISEDRVSIFRLVKIN